MRPKCPCKDCEKRKLLCHGFCKEYQEWKEKFGEITNGLREENEAKTNKRDQPYWRKWNRMNSKK